MPGGSLEPVGGEQGQIEQVANAVLMDGRAQWIADREGVLGVLVRQGGKPSSPPGNNQQNLVLTRQDLAN